jgi:hypothetical protein
VTKTQERRQLSITRAADSLVLLAPAQLLQRLAELF